MATFAPTLAFYTQAFVIMGNAMLKATLGRLDYDGLARGSHCLMRALERSGVRFEVSGLDTLSAGQGPFVFVSNHMSAMETQVLPGIIGLHRPLTFVVKPSLMKYPGFRRVLGTFDPIVVSRTDPRADLRHVLAEGKRKLEEGSSVIIFPQARRAETFDPDSFGTLGMRLAKAAGVPMVPVALDTSAWRKGALAEDLGVIDTSRTARFAIGAPISIDGDPAGAHRAVSDFIAGQLADWDKAPAR